MKKLIESLSVKHAFIIVFVVPALTIGYYMTKTLLEPISTLSRMNEIEKLSDMVVISSNLVHELQKERGRSSGFFNSGGTKFASELINQRNETDQKLNIFLSYLKSHEDISFGSIVDDNLKEIKKELNLIENNRIDIDNLHSTAPKVLGYYTNIIALMLNNVGTVATLANHEMELYHTIKAYRNLMEFKERNGVMRAVYSGVFGKGSFTPFLYKKAITLDAEAQLFEVLYLKYANQKQTSFYKRTVVGKDVEEVNRMQSFALEQYDTTFSDITPEYWFACITAKIDLLKKVEDEVAKDLLASSGQLSRKAANSLWLNISVVLVLGVLIIYVGMSIVRKINNMIKKSEKIRSYQENEASKLSEAMQKLAKGDISFELNVEEADDELVEVRETFLTITKSINNMLNTLRNLIEDANHLTEAANSGNLKYRIDKKKHSGAYQTLVIGMNSLIQSFSSVILQVQEVVQSIAIASNEITDNTNTMASSAEELNKQTDEVVYAIEEMAKTIDTNAANTTQTDSLAQDNSKIALQGKDVVSNTVDKMKEIAGVVTKSSKNIETLGDSSKKIGEIISVIEEIADQTNLLALNAAIEAARAGEQGRGFAVVADEVRKLAERTTDATKQISQMIIDIQNETSEAVRIMNTGSDEVNNGIVLADDAGNSLSHIVESSTALLDMIAQIATASEEQASTSRVISQNANSMSEVTSDTVRRIGDIAKAISSTSEQSNELMKSLNEFNVK